MQPARRPGAVGTAVGVVLAAGIGSRVGADGNKAYLRLAGRSMVSWSVDALLATPGIERTILVYRRGELDLVSVVVGDELDSAAIELVEGGDSRHGSEWNVLRHLSADIESGAVDTVLIHDAARPLAGPALAATALRLAREFGGAIPALSAHDPLRVTPDGLFAATALVRVQTPQAFWAPPLLDAYRRAAADGFEGTDTSSCVERYTELDVHAFPGAATNFKVTYAPDVLVAEALLRGSVSGIVDSR